MSRHKSSLYLGVRQPSRVEKYHLKSMLGVFITSGVIQIEPEVAAWREEVAAHIVNHCIENGLPFCFAVNKDQCITIKRGGL